MNQNVIKAGDKLAITLPNEVIDALNLSEGSQVSIKLDTERNYVLLTPGDDRTSEIDPTFTKQLAEFIDQYRPALEALAK